MPKKPAPKQAAPKKRILFIVYDASKKGIEQDLDDKIEKAVGRAYFNNSIYVVSPYDRALQFHFDTLDQAKQAAVRVGQMANKIKRIIRYNTL